MSKKNLFNLLLVSLFVSAIGFGTGAVLHHFQASNPNKQTGGSQKVTNNTSNEHQKKNLLTEKPSNKHQKKNLLTDKPSNEHQKNDPSAQKQFSLISFYRFCRKMMLQQQQRSPVQGKEGYDAAVALLESNQETGCRSLRDIQPSSKDGYKFPIHYAIETKNLHVLQVLLGNSCFNISQDILIRDSQGHTAMDYVNLLDNNSASFKQAALAILTPLFELRELSDGNKITYEGYRALTTSNQAYRMEYLRKVNAKIGYRYNELQLKNIGDHLNENKDWDTFSSYINNKDFEAVTDGHRLALQQTGVSDRAILDSLWRFARYHGIGILYKVKNDMGIK